MINFTSSNGKVAHNGRTMRIHTALKSIYEKHRTNTATIDNRIVRFDNTGWCFVDELPERVKDKVLARYDKDAERMLSNK